MTDDGTISGLITLGEVWLVQLDEPYAVVDSKFAVALTNDNRAIMADLIPVSAGVAHEVTWRSAMNLTSDAGPVDTVIGNNFIGTVLRADAEPGTEELIGMFASQVVTAPPSVLQLTIRWPKADPTGADTAMSVFTNRIWAEDPARWP